MEHGICHLHSSPHIIPVLFLCYSMYWVYFKRQNFRELQIDVCGKIFLQICGRHSSPCLLIKGIRTLAWEASKMTSKLCTRCSWRGRHKLWGQLSIGAWEPCKTMSKLHGALPDGSSTCFISLSAATIILTSIITNSISSGFSQYTGSR